MRSVQYLHQLIDILNARVTTLKAEVRHRTPKTRYYTEYDVGDTVFLDGHIYKILKKNRDEATMVLELPHE